MLASVSCLVSPRNGEAPLSLHGELGVGGRQGGRARVSGMDLAGPVEREDAEQHGQKGPSENLVI